MTAKTGIELSELIAALDDPVVDALRDVRIAGITSDSRAVKPGYVFVAVQGVTTDGHAHVAGAVAGGAAAVVLQRTVDAGDAVRIVVEDSARALARLAARFCGDPADALRLFGVSGTNGKTSTAHLFRAIFEKADVGTIGVLGTIGHGMGTQLEAALHTTPEPVLLHKLLKGVVEENGIGVVMEVSSHAVRQQRTWGLDFEIGMLTNVTRDHLDYHSSFEDYVDAKREFCYSLVSPSRRKPAGTLVYSRDNEHSRRIGESFPGTAVTTSIRETADVYADDIDASLEGTRFKLHLGDDTTDVNMRLLGEFSVANAVTAAAGAHMAGIPASAIKAGLESVERVPGRFDAMGGGGRPVVIVDYSHTPDSLERTLAFCRELKPARLIVVFGCGGDRDRGKRPLMGRIAQDLADVCIVTSDNPRTEDPMAIIEDILSGVERGREGLYVEVDRRSAIELAVRTASAGDLVAICGKGHEDYQIIGTTKHRFDDREEARRALQAGEAS